MKVIYSEEDQKLIDMSNVVIKAHEYRLIQSLKAPTGDEREITKRFIGDHHRQQLIKSKADMMAVMIPTYTMVITK